MQFSEDQQKGYEAYVRLLTDPNQKYLVISGGAGVGKSTLVKKCLEDTPKILKSNQLISSNLATDYTVTLTATTNKAAEALEAAIDAEGLVTTIYSHLGFRVSTDYRSGKTHVVRHRGAVDPHHEIIFIDEAGFLDSQMLARVMQVCSDRCKLVFIGDAYQINPVGEATCPVFSMGLPTVTLEKIMRQADGSPVAEMSQRLREVVETQEFFTFEPDNDRIKHVPREEFDRLIMEEFDRPDWGHLDSKVLAWTNAAVIAYNKGIREFVSGDPELTINDYAINNRALVFKKGQALKTDATVLITDKYPATRHSVTGHMYQLNRKFEVFAPDSWDEANIRLKEAKQEEEFTIVQEIMDTWADLRAAYSCTLNKSQGSTYTKVFIDLDDVGRCRNNNALSRLLYVGVSRAKEQVIFTGDLA